MNTATLQAVDGLDWSDDGYSSLSGDLLEFSRQLDQVFRGWASDLDADDHQFPSMISAKSLAPIAYLKSFPHLATFATSADRREESLRSIAREYGTAEQINASGERLEPVTQLLTPAACYHFYPRLSGTDRTSTLFLTTNCQCHRREDHYLPLQRQWCFQMREIVCIGNRDAISDFTEDLRTQIETLVDCLGLTADWQIATDPFFDPANDPKALSQILEPVKQELCTPQGLAISSINKHRSFFGERYRIHHDGEPAHSACVAFGIERWLYAMLETHGVKVEAWPTPEVLQ